jgi:hypothetical protein
MLVPRCREWGMPQLSVVIWCPEFLVFKTKTHSVA